MRSAPGCFEPRSRSDGGRKQLWGELSAQSLGKFFDLFQLLVQVFGELTRGDLLDLRGNGVCQFCEFISLALQLGKVDTFTYRRCRRLDRAGFRFFGVAEARRHWVAPLEAKQKNTQNPSYKD